MDIEETLKSIKENIGEEAYAKASNEFADILSLANSQAGTINDQTKEIETLKADKEELTNANQKLFQRVSFENTSNFRFSSGETKQDDEPKRVDIKDILD